MFITPISNRTVKRFLIRALFTYILIEFTISQNQLNVAKMRIYRLIIKQIAFFIKHK